MAASKKDSGRFVGFSPRCESCGNTTSIVVDKRARETDRRGDIYRRRECKECSTRFSTWEVDKRTYKEVLNYRRFITQARAMLHKLGKHGINRFEGLEKLQRPERVAKIWNDRTFAEGVDYGARLALIQLFGFDERK